MKKSWSNPGELSRYLRKLFLIFLVFTFLIATGALFLRHSFSEKLNSLSQQIQDPAQPPEITNALLELSSAENDFQKASISGSQADLDSYKTKLRNILVEIDGIVKKYQSDSPAYFPEGHTPLEKSFNRKLQLSQEVFELRHSVDSLLNVTTIQGINSHPVAKPKPVITARRHFRPVKITADTIIKEVTVSKTRKGLFSRLRDAIANRDEKTASVRTVTVNREREIRDSVSSAMKRKQNFSTEQLIRKLNEENSHLTASNKLLVSANLNLVTQLHGLIRELKDIHLNAWEKRKNATLSQYQSAANELNQFTGLAIMMVLVFVILLIIYIRKAGRAEDQYLIENERAVMLAEQKSEMLAIMSHEIRNPLTTITGMIYMLNRTMVSPEQQKKLSTIKHASAMLMDTVNNVLDVSKINYQKAEGLELIAFRPCAEIRETVSVMSYMAENKNIYLRAEFDCDEDLMVSGDVFRLKQVMINLLSNALKYTDEGGITVKVSFGQGVSGIAELNVQVIDTGAGIPRDKQSKLFTRYYQVGRSQDKQGTGLGLYICQQIIELQNGLIAVESEPGRGSNFHFSIPYQRAG